MVLTYRLRTSIPYLIPPFSVALWVIADVSVAEKVGHFNAAFFRTKKWKIFFFKYFYISFLINLFFVSTENNLWTRHDWEHFFFFVNFSGIDIHAWTHDLFRDS